MFEYDLKFYNYFLLIPVFLNLVLLLHSMRFGVFIIHSFESIIQSSYQKPNKDNEENRFQTRLTSLVFMNKIIHT